ncbi:MAG: Smr/MutS family protein [Alphaproteobacteria bacterium]|nr:Smr/MutS family protein [Alphaproteobacteria bacterium]
MKSFIKIFVIYKLCLISFVPISAKGLISSQDEVEARDEGAYKGRKLSASEADFPSSNSYSSLELLYENFAFVANMFLSSFLGDSDNQVHVSVPKRDDNIPITNCKDIKVEEPTSQTSIKRDKRNIEQEGSVISVANREKEASQQNEQPLLLARNLEHSKNKTTQLNQQDSVAKPNPVDYTQKIALGQNKGIRLPKKPYEEYIPIIETLIQKVIHDKIEKPVKVHVLVGFDERQDFHASFENLVNTYTKYPSQFSWSKGNKGYTKGENPSCIFELTLVSHAKKREQVENDFAYHISDEDRQHVNWDYVYDIAMRSNFTLEDFQYNNRIKVRLLDCQGDTEEKVLEEFQQFLEQKLVKDHDPFHIIGITFNPKIKEDQGGMLGSFLGKVSVVNIGLRTRGTICNSTNGLLYLCLGNMNRKRLDLHGKCLPTGEYKGRSVKVAEEETKKFIMQAYKTFQEDVTVCTGRGKHVNANKTNGTLKGAFNDWMKDEQVAPLIKKSILCQGDGEYKVIFVKTCHLDLINTKPQNIMLAIKKTIVQMIEQKNKRLRIALGPKTGPSTENREFDFLLKLYADLKENDPKFAEFLLPISCESTPGEMKIIFNQQHSKSHWGFSFFNSHGSTGFYGTIRKPGD